MRGANHTISFRGLIEWKNNTADHLCRYAEGRRYWAQLVMASQNLGRVFWIHALERDGMREKDVLAKA